MEACRQAVVELGLEIEGAQRMQVIPIKDSDEVQVEFFDYGEAEDRRPTRERRRLAAF